MNNYKEIVEAEYKILGYWKLPKFLEKCLNNSFTFTLLYCIYATVTSCMLAGVTVVNMGDVEDRFDLSKSDSAIIASGANIGFCVFVIFVSYFGENWNKAVAIAVSSGIFGIGAFFYALPHFTTGLHEIAESRFQLKCVPEWKPDCEVIPEVRYVMYIMFVGQFLMGASMSTFYTLGFTYLEQSVSQRRTSMYFGQFYVFINVGATVGILGTIALLQDIYVDFNRAEAPTQIENWDSRWVGAWWLFPLICMAVSFILMLIFAGYPKYMRGASQFYHRKSKETYDFKQAEDNGITFENNFRGFLKGLANLVCNPTFVFLTLAGCIQNLVFTGASSFISKYFEQALNMSAEDSGYIFGFLFALGGMLGSFIGGFVIFAFNWGTKGIIKFCGFCVFLTAVLSPSFLLHCDNIPIAGVTVKYGFQDDFTRPTSVNVTAACNEHCLCQEESYIPVCGSDNITYFSPCHAGCPYAVAPYTYGQCQCVKHNLDNDGIAGFRATVDACGEECHFKYYNLALNLVMVLCLGMVFSPILVATLRLVPNRLKSLSLGLQAFLFRCLGTIPAAELYGAVLAPACLLWIKDMCTGKQGSCNIYDNAGMAIGLMLPTLFGCLLAFVFTLAAVHFYKPTEGVQQTKLKSMQERSLNESSIDENFVEEFSKSDTDDDRTSASSASTRF